MIKVNVGLSRKLSRDYNSTGFSINLEGEIAASLDDPNLMIARIQQFYDLAEETLALQIERLENGNVVDTSATSQASHGRASEPTKAYSAGASATDNGNGNHPSAEHGNGNGKSHDAEAATNKQIQFLLTLGKRNGLSKPQLENRIAGIIGRQVTVYDLSKREAGSVLEELAGNENEKAAASRKRF